MYCRVGAILVAVIGLGSPLTAQENRGADSALVIDAVAARVRSSDYAQVRTHRIVLDPMLGPSRGSPTGRHRDPQSAATLAAKVGLPIATEQERQRAVAQGRGDAGGDIQVVQINDPTIQGNSAEVLVAVSSRTKGRVGWVGYVHQLEKVDGRWVVKKILIARA